MAWIPVDEMLDLTARDAQPPLYPLALRVWTEMAGSGFLATRYLGLALSTASVALLFRLGWRLHGPPVGWVAALLLAISPYYLYHSASRFPAPALFFHLFLLDLLLAKVGRHNPGRLARGAPAWAGLPFMWAGYVAMGLASLYLSYLSLAPLLAHGAYLAIRSRWTLFRQWCGASLVIAIGFSPWLAYVLQRHGGPTWGLPPEQPPTYFPLDPLSGHLAIALGYYAALDPPLALPAWAYTAGLLGLLGLGWVRWKDAPRRIRPGGWLVPLLLAVSIIVASLAAIYWKNGHLGPKYPAIGLPYFLLLLAFLFVVLSGSRRAVLIVLVTPVLLLWLAGHCARQSLVPDWDDLDLMTQMREFALDQIPATDMAVFTNPGHAGYYQAWFGGQRSWFLVMADPGYPLPPEREQQATQKLLDRAGGSYRAFWTFLIGGEHGLNEPLRARLREMAFPAGHQWFPYMLVVAYSLAREPLAPGPAGIIFQRGIELQGSAFTARAEPGGSVNLALRWRATESVDQDYKVFVHLVDGAGQRWAQHDGDPDGGDRPTSAWGPGEVVQDRHGLLLPDDLAPGEYRLLVGLYTGRGRLQLAAGGDTLAIGPITVAAPPPSSGVRSFRRG